MRASSLFSASALLLSAALGASAAAISGSSSKTSIDINISISITTSGAGALATSNSSSSATPASRTGGVVPLASSTGTTLSPSAVAGYLMVHFTETGGANQEQVYFSVAPNANPQNMVMLNGGQPVLSPTGVGRSGARDPFILKKQDGSYVVMATDSNLTAANFDFNQISRTGSKNILFWYSNGSDLTKWSGPSLIQVANNNMGMAWAPEAIWIPARNQYMITFATRTFASSDPNHTGTPSQDQIWAAYTSDFRTFGAPFLYLGFPSHGVIDLTMKRIGGSQYVRFFKDEGAMKVRGQVTNGGPLAKSWTDIGGSSDWVDKTSAQSEAPMLFQDNLNPSLWHIWVDLYGQGVCDGYEPFQTTSLTTRGVYTASSKAGFPACGVLKQGRVVPITQAQMTALKAAYP